MGFRGLVIFLAFQDTSGSCFLLHPCIFVALICCVKKGCSKIWFPFIPPFALLVLTFMCIFVRFCWNMNVDGMAEFGVLILE